MAFDRNHSHRLSAKHLTGHSAQKRYDFGAGSSDENEGCGLGSPCSLCQRDIKDAHFNCHDCGEVVCLSCFDTGIKHHNTTHGFIKRTIQGDEVVDIDLLHDKAFIEAIPELYTLDLSNMHCADSSILESTRCKCNTCEEWFKWLCSRYAEPVFCIQTTTNAEDFDFYRKYNIDWPSVYADESMANRSLGEFLAAAPGFGDRWALITCISHPICAGKNTGYEMSFLFPHSKDIDLTYKSDFGPQLSVRSFSSDDPSAASFSSRIGDIIEIINSAENWRRANEYILECQREHTSCRERDEESRVSMFYPTMLIDVEAESDQPIRLVQGSSLNKTERRVDYLALSYCWGGCTPPFTTIENVNERKRRGFQLENQPRTIQDAVTATRKLGFRYIWIDSLCIIQDREDDKEKELSQMDQIYQHATLLLSAARAEAANDGFLGDVDPEGIRNKEIGFCIPFRYQSTNTQGHLVKVRMALPAISAVAKQLSSEFGGGSYQTYVAGHFASHLPADLLWGETKFGDPFPKPLGGPFPTRSWISSNGPQWETEYGTYWHATTKISDITVGLGEVARDMYGTIKFARLLMRGIRLLVSLRLDVDSLDSKGRGIEITLTDRLLGNLMRREMLLIECKIDSGLDEHIRKTIHEVTQDIDGPSYDVYKFRSANQAAATSLMRVWTQHEHAIIEICRPSDTTRPLLVYSHGLILRRVTKAPEEIPVYIRIGQFKLVAKNYNRHTMKIGRSRFVEHLYDKLEESEFWLE
ncbi:heterokaryon incompatibility protein-domain-containing protein [Xylaria telfairii]|nr:heterokaryon incompatibility protein-domain-containing protein [Xylaria telfairii]